MQDPALIIGASGTIGSAIARNLSASGMPIILHGREDGAQLKALAKALGAPSFAGDLSDTEEALAFGNAVIRRTPRLSGLIFAAARPFPHKLTLRTDWSVFQEQLDSQLKALHLVMQQFKPALENRDEGARVILLSTEYVLGAPPPKIAPYLAAKAALTAYGQVLAQELLKARIRVHIVAPGMIKSALTADMPDEYLDMVAAEMPEGRLTSADDVARLCGFLISAGGDPLYGTVIPVSRAGRR